jgi:cytochrome c
MAVILTAAMTCARPSLASEELALQYGCVACHQLEFPLVGPPFQEIAGKYRDADETTVEAIVGRVVNGSTGIWGPVEMPPLPLLTDEDARALVSWVLTLDSEQ